MNKILIWFLSFIVISLHTHAQTSNIQSLIERDVKAYFSNSSHNDIASTPHFSYLKKVTADKNRLKITITIDGSFAQQEINDNIINKIYKQNYCIYYLSFYILLYLYIQQLPQEVTPLYMQNNSPPCQLRCQNFPL